ncbi:MAG: electron transfer flavoprotein subunit alpha/FixB family protein [Gracilibacteraceae bacterium]|jgi:electron transfer flavoprotein alpha subunit|nr:electron transfer flavoprotein subunit alpha/FixB family protein [Gracilibacteraceae bacterium]
MAKLWVIAEKADTAVELLAWAKELGPAEQLVCLTGNPAAAAAAAVQGADRVLLFSGAARPEAYVPDWLALAQREEPAAILLGADRRAKEIAAALAAGLDAGLVSDCVQLRQGEGEGYYSERYIYGGLALLGETTTRRPLLATIPAGKVTPLPARAAVAVENMSGTRPDPVRLVELRPQPSVSALTEARVIVCVGRGLLKQEDLRLARDLAAAFGGEIGCTRPIAEERRWLPEKCYLGITGQKAAPELYITLGVSGQIQHMSGVRDSKCIVAVEKNDAAPIVEAADYTIIGDLYEVTPQLLAALKDQGGGR